ncbi:hypothetical protein ASG35_30530 [Burkholderia sp. Leaf177]|uniref:lysozyme inhibitor LprI family protein n=1 Tax=Burkholderia sp. Leaf177 TaxID=1736287 RepID=UPI0006F94852|nr:lysozyme inhibitor LprI family protein [Burkholderia sp. Leaf177]KQR80196.1 hypothetical protein ASG35_30530 [Burkholderia sp. Leaf177]
MIAKLSRKTRRWIVSLLLISGIGAAALATPALADEPKDKTSEALDACLNNPKTVSTADMSGCYSVAYKAFDHRLNVAYQNLLKTLPAAPAQKLKASQRAWLTFRDAELATQSAIFATRQGTIYVPMQEDEGMSLTRDRALRLESYLSVMSVDGQ